MRKDSEGEVNVSNSRDTHYEERNGSPDIYVRNGYTKRNVCWTPIKPILRRTPSEFKVCFH